MASPNVQQPAEGTPAPEAVTRYFSFGYSHFCPITHKELIGYHATVSAPTAALCRSLMVEMFDNRWAFEYATEAAMTRDGKFLSVEHIRIEFFGTPDRPARSPR